MVYKHRTQSGKVRHYQSRGHYERSLRGMFADQYQKKNHYKKIRTRIRSRTKSGQCGKRISHRMNPTNTTKYHQLKNKYFDNLSSYEAKIGVIMGIRAKNSGTNVLILQLLENNIGKPFDIKKTIRDAKTPTIKNKQEFQNILNEMIDLSDNNKIDLELETDLKNLIVVTPNKIDFDNFRYYYVLGMNLK